MSPFPETPELGKIYVILEAPRLSDWMLGPIPGQGGRWVGQTGGKILPAHVYRNEEERWCGLLLSSVLGWWPLLFSKSGGAVSDTGCMVSQPFAAGGNRLYLEFWVITGGLWYSGY
jgi:hypothetical protein